MRACCIVCTISRLLVQRTLDFQGPLLPPPTRRRTVAIKRKLKLVLPILIFVLTNLFFPSISHAQQDSSYFTIDFRVNRSTLDTSYMNTGRRLRELSDSISSIGLARIERVKLISYSSPEGPAANNARLSQKRAATIGRYLISAYPQLEGRLSIKADGESWHLFRDRVLTESTLTQTQRDRLLEIIDSPVSADRKKALIESWSPELWRRCIREWFPYMRRSVVRIDYLRLGPVAPLHIMSDIASSPIMSDFVSASTGGLAPRTQEIQRQEPSWGDKLWSRRTILALKTNMLYDAVTALNFELEVPLGDNFSLAVEDVCPWWNLGTNGNKYCFQIWEMGVEPRWWFLKTSSRDRLSGHFLGLYGMSGKYDLQWDKALCYQGELWSAGATYGYVLPLSKWCNLELSASLGYLRSDYRHYEPGAAYEHLYRDPARTGVFSYFGPTKLKISLMIPITVRRRAER